MQIFLIIATWMVEDAAARVVNAATREVDRLTSQFSSDDNSAKAGLIFTRHVSAS